VSTGAIVMVWQRVPRPLRMICSGGAATTVDTAVLVLLCWGAGLPAGLAAALGCLAGGVTNFAITRRAIFGARGRGWLEQAARYALLVVGGGAAVSAFAVAGLVALGLPLLVAKAGAVVIALGVWTYPMSARVVFAPTIQTPS
jgi:putative flippase GtrA